MLSNSSFVLHESPSPDNKSDIDYIEDQNMSHFMSQAIVMAWEIPNPIKIWTS